MAAAQQDPTTTTGTGSTPNVDSDPRPDKIDRNAPAGSENSLGAQSVRDGRPSTDDSVVEAMDEEGPDITPGS